ncbi:hypothetical protein T4A_1707 [Trichinella pseudospiralis]|uniref:Uncharacterized protein n=1 Tax=Trichinella pseudospiralis TaxID=6337 RepID=A0A0V1EQR5_TRIPS|nr:hypothetical protein T4A_1707 [Trichinella pseudospiralis]KRZ40591.1 hypothetical protein T4C_8750 [Trichinella pseudospiralis]
MKRKNRTTPTRLFNSRPAQPLPHPKSSNNTTSDKLVVEWMFAPQRGQCSFNVATDDEITVHRTSSATKHPVGRMQSFHIDFLLFRTVHMDRKIWLI